MKQIEILERFFQFLGEGRIDEWASLLDANVVVSTPFSPKGSDTEFSGIAEVRARFMPFRGGFCGGRRIQEQLLLAVSLRRRSHLRMGRVFRPARGNRGTNGPNEKGRRLTLNADAERFVRSIKSECLAKIIPLGEQHLRHTVKEYTEHCHVERNHQGLDDRLIEERQGVVEMNSAVVRHERLGGVLNYYEREGRVDGRPSFGTLRGSPRREIWIALPCCARLMRRAKCWRASATETFVDAMVSISRLYK